ncbi:MAG TPA: substrate-binding domain-containing protein [Paracoccaceae bacterium]|nr:substrate-binding domain-containing protein [Paracoccaceae bacterium]
MTTLKDISRRSGYSVTTVSRALNGFDDVTEATRQRIEAIAREMNYRPNQVARKLVSGRSGMVGLVLEAPPSAFEYGHFFELVSGLSRAFSARDMDFVLHVGTGGDVLTTYKRLINRGTLDGFVVTAPEIGDARIALLLEREVPFVVHGHQIGDASYAYYDADNRAISQAAVSFLADLGHRRIGLLNGPEQWTYAQERLRGFRDALAERGLPFDPALVRHGDTSQAYGAQAGAELLGDPSTAPTAFICCNSLAAAGLLESLRARGLAVPRDISIVAHDDDLPQVQTDRLDPPLTVTWLPLRDCVEPLVELIIRRIRGEPVSDLQITNTAPLIERGSTRPAPGPRV